LCALRALSVGVISPNPGQPQKHETAMLSARRADDRAWKWHDTSFLKGGLQPSQPIDKHSYILSIRHEASSLNIFAQQLTSQEFRSPFGP
jgi:hypothetical protein